MKHIKIQLLIILGIFINIPLIAQLNIGGIPYSFNHESISRSDEGQRLPNLDMTLVKEVDRRDEANGLPPRFGYPFDVSYSLYNSGIWQTLENGDRLWQLTILCPNAKSINLLYDAFWLPKGATLYIYNRDKSHVIGGFTERNNHSEQGESKGFATGLVYGDQITLEYYEPADVMHQGEISIAKVIHGYRYIRQLLNLESRELGTSGSCHKDIGCPEGRPWQDEKNGVAMILVDGHRICSGSLVRNVSGEPIPYFLTANHCLGDFDAVDNPNANTWSFYWNYESPGCFQFQRDSDVPFSVTSGAVVVANNSVNDFALLRLVEDPINLGIPLAYNGWDARGYVAESAVGIHHPRGDLKKISIEFNAVRSTVPNGNNINNRGVCWQVRDWDVGAIEGGSSGSPLFDRHSKMIIGQLWGGDSDCDSSSQSDNDMASWYGKFSVSWTGNGSNDRRRRLKDWLGAVCDLDLIIEDDIEGETPILHSPYQIDAYSTVKSGANATILSLDRIVFKPGFKAERGSRMVAKIGGCGEESSPHFQGPFRLPPLNRLASVVESETLQEATHASLKSRNFSLKVSPNPFSTTASIHFSIPNETKLDIEIRNHLGQIVRSIANKKVYQAGDHSLTLSRDGLPAGIYYCMLRSDKQQLVQKVVIGQ